MTTPYDKHKRRWYSGNSDSEYYLNEAINNFNELVDNKLSPSVHTVKYTIPLDHKGFYANPIDGLVDDAIIGKSVVCSDLDSTNTELTIKDGLETNILISDIARNEQVKDVKLLHTKLNSQIDSGSYISWQDEMWLVLNQEHNAVQSHNTFTINKCGIFVNMKVDGNIYSYPVIISNLTIYSDGAKELVDMTLSSAKYSIQIAENEITNTINVGTRFAIRERMFEVTIVDDFTIKNVRTLTVVETVTNSLDDLENNIAWNENADKEKIDNPNLKIVGSDFIYVGGTAEYECSNIIEWELERTEKAKIISSEIGKCKIKCGTSSDYVGEKIILYATDERGNMKEKIIYIRGLF